LAFYRHLMDLAGVASEVEAALNVAANFAQLSNYAHKMGAPLLDQARARQLLQPTITHTHTPPTHTLPPHTHSPPPHTHHSGMQVLRVSSRRQPWHMRSGGCASA
jgi:hypothetical protein